MTAKLTDADCAILRQIAAGESDPAALGDDADEVTERLSQLANNGLVSREEGEYALTPSGRRVLEAHGDEPADDTDDLPTDVDLAIAAFDLRPDAEEAVRRAARFLRNWEEATASEIVDGVYSESPAGWDDEDEWWRELVRERLAALPRVVPPGDGDGDDRWRYAGETPTDADDGRRVIDSEERYGSAKHAIEREAESEREADHLSAAFEVIEERDRVASGKLAAALDADLDRIADSLAALPGVEREGETWLHTPEDEARDGEAGR